MTRFYMEPAPPGLEVFAFVPYLLRLNKAFLPSFMWRRRPLILYQQRLTVRARYTALLAYLDPVLGAVYLSINLQSLSCFRFSSSIFCSLDIPSLLPQVCVSCSGPPRKAAGAFMPELYYVTSIPRSREIPFPSPRQWMRQME